MLASTAISHLVARPRAARNGLASRGEAMGWILHGHGTGALKEAVRAWLPGVRTIKRWRPADNDEGGDAFTIVEVLYIE